MVAGDIDAISEWVSTNETMWESNAPCQSPEGLELSELVPLESNDPVKRWDRSEGILSGESCPEWSRMAVIDMVWNEWPISARRSRLGDMGMSPPSAVDLRLLAIIGVCGVCGESGFASG